MFKRVGILGHPLRPSTGEVCTKVAQTLRALGVTAWCETLWDADAVRPMVAQTDLIIAIGGDGSMLRAARVSAEFNVPVFGINAGHLGFLTEASLDDWDTALESLLAGRFWIESRMMLDVGAWRASELLTTGTALNDVVVSRGAVAKAVLLDAYIDGDWTTTYNADGLIVSTPTGSTAYALAVGGPILPPELKNILVVPVAPHLTLDRPIVLAEGATIEVVIAEETTTNVALTVDGESYQNWRRSIRWWYGQATKLAALYGCVSVAISTAPCSTAWSRECLCVVIALTCSIALSWREKHDRNILYRHTRINLLSGASNRRNCPALQQMRALYVYQMCGAYTRWLPLPRMCVSAAGCLLQSYPIGCLDCRAGCLWLRAADWLDCAAPRAVWRAVSVAASGRADRLAGV